MTRSCEEPVLTVRASEEDVRALAAEAAQALAEASALRTTLHGPGVREHYRTLLERAIALAERAASIALDGTEPRASIHLTLVEAHAEKAEDALHGAGQLSLSAQRAPTHEACDEGWQRVETIVAGAEASAACAVVSRGELEQLALRPAQLRAARKAALKAEVAGQAARRIVSERNHAYTFHTDRRFSFGEGWYLAAAAVLAGVIIQVEPDTDGTAQAEQFLRDAGLLDRCQPYRSRPRAMKHTTHLVARAFRADPAAAQHRVRTAFLGDGPISSPVSDWVDQRLAGAPEGEKVLVWIREGVHHAARNSAYDEVAVLVHAVAQAGLVPVLTGDALRGPLPAGAVDLILFWKDPVFCGIDKRRAQLQFFERLRSRHQLIGQLGVTTAGMDGPALLGLPTLYLTDVSNVRMREWVGAVPGYREVVREPGYLDRVRGILDEWKGA